jgi:hypothetical protein
MGLGNICWIFLLALVLLSPHLVHFLSSKYAPYPVSHASLRSCSQAAILCALTQSR